MIPCFYELSLWLLAGCPHWEDNALAEFNSCFGPVEKAAALVFLLYLLDLKPSCEQVDHTVAHSRLAEIHSVALRLKFMQIDFGTHKVNDSVTQLTQKLI